MLIAAAFFAAVAPSLSWLEFTNGGENLLAATVVEMHDSGPWLAPTLNGQPRIRKPPLPAWTSAAMTPRATVAALNATDPTGRRLAYDWFAWTLRWPALLMGAVVVLIAYGTARTIGEDEATSLIAAIVCATSVLMLRNVRLITTDIHLTLWVAAANLFLLRGILVGRAMVWLPLAGAMLGLAFMSKGPVAILQSVVPVLVWRIWCGRRQTGGLQLVDRGLGMASVVAGLVFLVVGLPWFVYVLSTTPDASRIWLAEVTRAGATSLSTDPVYTYANIVPLMTPWAVFCFAGLIAGVAQRKRHPARLLPVLLVLAPIIVMSFFKDKNDRYLLPMVVPAAVVAAAAIRPQLRVAEERSHVDRRLLLLHWVLLGAVVLGVPVAGAFLPSADGGTWWGWPVALGGTLATAGLLWATIALHRRVSWAMVVGTMALMFGVHHLLLLGYQSYPDARSQMKPIADDIVRLRPAGTVWYADFRESTKPMPQDLQVYLNRTIRTITDPGQLPPNASDQVIVMLRRAGEADPEIPGFQEIARRPTEKNRSWHAFAGRR